MNKEQLQQENNLLREQVDALINRVEELTNSNSFNSETISDWRQLVGKVRTDSGVKVVDRAVFTMNHLNKLFGNQANRGNEKGDQAKIEEWTTIHTAELAACEFILENKMEVHALCEVRDRKHNQNFGLPPTISEMVEMINQPETAQPKATESDKEFDDLFKMLEEPNKIKLNI
jgi:hypothetical protein